ncbi:hypothetical protein EC973_009374 [Apophysomyces ossiformis]|uniref:CENP-V/GFA domain-containing protein n=1 Tax=Apophysomyces ossiformis TaxID=679940 RepID=A0A8H7BYM9_9FUNG|nr:hypothetical protein EC973_009374 [Apophysomyces ossiformis]
MELHGSCHCGKFMRCYCSICRKCQGGGGYGINIMGVYKTLEVKGKEFMREYRAIRDKESNEVCGNIRYFCGECGSHLYCYDKQYAEYVYPYASAIDTKLPCVEREDIYHIMLNDDSKANWAIAPAPSDAAHAFREYPDTSLEDWHKKHGKYVN